MELVICIALGIWISFGGWLSYRSLKKEYDSRKQTEDRGV